MKNLVSIVIPVKNGEKYLKECLNSILNQSIKNWELIIVNDNSTDKTWEILQEYKEKDSRITILKNKGNGIIDALQLAYSMTRGNLITRMDADDKMTKNKLEVLSNNLLKSGVGHIATGKVAYFSETELGEGYRNYETWLNQLIENGLSYTEIYKECVIPSPCWMVFREDFEKLKGFNSNIYPEDYDLCFRFYKQNLKVIPENEILHYWRDYATRTSRTDKNYADNFFLNIKMKYFFELDYDSNKTLEIWGAGKKGKEIARYLIEEKIDFHWVCNNENKIGKEIYGKIMQSETEIFSVKNPQIIVSVGNLNEQKTIKNILNSKGLKPNFDYFFFS